MPAGTIWAAMRMVKSYCCSTPCSSDPQFLEAGSVVARRVQVGGAAALAQLGVMELRQLAAVVDAASQVSRVANASSAGVHRKDSNVATSRDKPSGGGNATSLAAKSKWEALAEVKEETSQLLNEAALRKELHAVLVLGSH